MAYGGKYFINLLEGRTMTRDQAQAELDYIRTINANYPGPNFNNNPVVFDRYCDMQAHSFQEHGFNDLANAIWDHWESSFDPDCV